MAKVQVTINGVKGEVEEGLSLLEAAKVIGAPLANACCGNAICSTCRVSPISGAESLSPRSTKEKVSLNYHMCFDDNVRLSCQTKVIGPGPVEVSAPKFFRFLGDPLGKKKQATV